MPKPCARLDLLVYARRSALIRLVNLFMVRVFGWLALAAGSDADANAKRQVSANKQGGRDLDVLCSHSLVLASGATGALML